MGLYQPDTVMILNQDGEDFLFTANEGADCGDANSKKKILLNIEQEVTDEKTYVAKNPPIEDRDFVFGTRSFSIFHAKTGQLVFDSGAQIEEMIAKYASAYFNTNDGIAREMDGRSDNSGAEPEAMTKGEVGEKQLLFVGLERVSLIGIWDVSDVIRPIFHSLNGFESCEPDKTGRRMTNVDPEALSFIAAAESPTGRDLLVASGSVSGTLVLYEVVKSSDPNDLFVRQDPACGP